MQHFIEIAEYLLPFVQSAARTGPRRAAGLSQLATECQTTFAERPAGAASSRRAPSTWQEADEHLALEILADMLAREPRVIPRALQDVQFRISIRLFSRT